MIVECLLQMGSKSISHMSNSFERNLEVLRLSADTVEAQVEVIAIT